MNEEHRNKLNRAYHVLCQHMIWRKGHTDEQCEPEEISDALSIATGAILDYIACEKREELTESALKIAEHTLQTQKNDTGNGNGTDSGNVKEYRTAEEVAESLGISEKTVLDWKKSGKLRYYTFCKGILVRFLAEDVKEQYLDYLKTENRFLKALLSAHHVSYSKKLERLKKEYAKSTTAENGK